MSQGLVAAGGCGERHLGVSLGLGSAALGLWKAQASSTGSPSNKGVPAL